jgi:hypothetical protein
MTTGRTGNEYPVPQSSIFNEVEDEFIPPASRGRRVDHEAGKIAGVTDDGGSHPQYPRDHPPSGRPVTRGLALFLLAICPLASAATHRVTAGLGSSGIQRVIRGASPGDTVSFDPGKYNITSGLTLKCGVTYTATTPATPSNVILSASFPEESTDIFTLNAGCSSQTTISYLSSLHAGLLFVSSPNSNLTVTHNQVGDLKCCNSQVYSPALYFNDAGSSDINFVTNATVTWNQLGDITSCTAPMNGMTRIADKETFEGICAGIIIQTSVYGMTIENNTFFHLGEGVHLVCYGQSCSPEDNPRGPVTRRLTARFNDFSQIHRIPWEEQPEAITRITFQYNSIHDWFAPYYGSFGISMACCANPASTPPYLTVDSNVIILNTTPAGRYGYGVEAWGTHARYEHNWIGTGKFSIGAPGITYGFGSPTSFNYNTICGGGFASAAYINQEFDGLTAPSQIGNVMSPTCSPVTSAAPSISPSGGNQSFPLKVTLTDPGFDSTKPVPNGNTGIWYTTDGSTPVPGAGTAQYLPSGGKFDLKAPATVKAVGMWGSGANPTSYPAGFGFVPSEVKSAQFTSGVARQQQRPR